MDIPDKHLSVINGNDTREICEPLFKSSDISFFIYCRFYEDGTVMSFPSNTEWHKHFMSKEYFSSRLRMNEGIHLWASQKTYTQAVIDAREDFNIDNKFEIVEPGKGYYDVFGFASPKDQVGIIDYYLNNVDYLKKFGLYFKNCAEPLITEAQKPENRINLRHQIIGAQAVEVLTPEKPVIDFMRNRIRHYYLNNKNKADLYLTSREMQVLLYTIQQRSAAEIGQQLNLSPKTVESYLASVKRKLDCETRAQLFDCVLESGLLQLINQKEEK